MQATFCSGTVACSEPTARPAPSSPHYSSPNTYVHAKWKFEPRVLIGVPGASSSSITKELVKNANSQALPQTCQIRNSEGGPGDLCIKRSSCCFWCPLEFENLCSTLLYTACHCVGLGGRLSLGQVHITQVNNFGFTLRRTRLGAQGPLNNWLCHLKHAISLSQIFSSGRW